MWPAPAAPRRAGQQVHQHRRLRGGLVLQQQQGLGVRRGRRRRAATRRCTSFLKVTVNGSSVTVTPVNAQGGTFDQQTYNFAADTTPPVGAGQPHREPSSTKNVLTWTAATDNIGVTAYDVYRNGTYLAHRRART